MISNVVLSIGKIRQLVDLNGDITNFKSDFEIQSENKELFQTVVVNQTILDSNTPLVFQDAIGGYISGDISNNSGIYQNYFLILRSDMGCNVNVSINTTELEPEPEPEPEPESFKLQFQKHPQKSKGVNWLKIVLIIIVIVLGALLLWYFYKQNNKPKKFFAFQAPSMDNHPEITPSTIHDAPSTIHDAPSTIQVEPQVASLLNRLNNLDI